MGRSGLLGRARVVSDLPAALREALLLRWREPHRRYHGEAHLRSGLEVLDRLGAGRLERIAFWFHDAVHSCSSPADEEASAALAVESLGGVVPPAEAQEVARLVLVTVDHDPDRADLAGARVSDADLAGLGSPWPRYVDNAAGLRAELPAVDDAGWLAARLRFIDTLEGRTEIFRTPLGMVEWEAAARRNLARERALLTTRPEVGTAGA